VIISSGLAFVALECLSVDFHNQASPWPGVVMQDAFAQARSEMVERQIRRRGIFDPHVLRAVTEVPRHEFVPEASQPRAYEDAPLAIGGGQTISQPYIVAAMTAALRLQPSDRVLDVGTGCGYQAAILSRIVAEVYSIEVRRDLALAAAERLARLGYSNVHVRCGDGTLGLPEFAPFDAILVAAAAPSIPQPLAYQLAESGRMILPVGEPDHQQLLLIAKHGNGYEKTMLDPCQFVPLIGQYGWREALS
jgi:protein-L-isoaspartate(D-aspartate) O-methyltransferase